MLAGAQLGVTVCSILLGRVAEPAVADLLDDPFALVGVPDPLLHTVAFVVALAIVVTLHVLLGEMVPKNIAIAGPETAAMLLIPSYLVYVRAVRPLIAFYNWCANITLRALRIEPRDELDIAVSTVELSEMIAESVSEGLLDPEEHTRLTRALAIRSRVVADIAVPRRAIRTVNASPAPARRSGRWRRRSPPPGSPGSRWSIRPGRSSGTCTSKTCSGSAMTPPRCSTASRCVRCPGCRRRCRWPRRFRLRRTNSHLALATAADGAVVAMVTLEDLVEDLVGTVRDGTHRI